LHSALEEEVAAALQADLDKEVPIIYLPVTFDRLLSMTEKDVRYC
jgi:hypothetical protein